MRIANEYTREVAQGKRLEFGKNWSKFLTVLDDGRIAIAELSLKEMLEVDDLYTLNGITSCSMSSIIHLKPPATFALSYQCPPKRFAPHQGTTLR